MFIMFRLIFDYLKRAKENISNSLIRYSFLFGFILDKLNINDNVVSSSLSESYHYNFAACLRQQEYFYYL